MKRSIVLTSLWLFISLLHAQSDHSSIKDAVFAISSEELLNYVGELSDDKYVGRLTGSPEYVAVSRWVAEQFASYGLEPGGSDGDWFQWFDQPYTAVGSDCLLELLVPLNKGDTIRKTYSYFDEYMPGSTSGSGDLTAEVVFAGWGITAPELNFDEYAGVDVQGKIVLLRPEAPVSPGAGAAVFGPWLTYSTHQYKMQNAINHGAVGVLYHYGPLANTNNDYHPGLINSLVGQAVVDDLFMGTDKVYAEIVDQIQRKLEPNSFPLQQVVRMKNETVHYPDGRGNNVLGLIRGSDPKLSHELIVIGAHLDHVGACYEVCPGAQDNASGIAAMLGVAKTLSSSDIRLKRSVLFIAFGAEEQGLIGSQHYVNHPVFPLEDTHVLLNMDCVGIGPNFHAGGGDNYPKIFAAIERANDRYIHRKLTRSFSANVGRPRTDAAVFMDAGVPSISFSSNGGRGYYHNPLDRMETIWPESLQAIASLISYASYELANTIQAQVKGPEKGSLIIAGGALRDSAVYGRFIELAGGSEAKIVIIPTASDDRQLDREGFLDQLEKFLQPYGVDQVRVLHTRSRAVANDPSFVQHITDASGVWIMGGRQWRLADSYLNTSTHEALRDLLDRGGVIGGSSAGATIQGSYLFRGDTKSNTILCGDHEEGLGFLNHVAIDQHLLARNRQFDLLEALERFPGILGIGLDENTAIEVQGSVFTVLGKHYVAVYDGNFYSRDRGGYVALTRGAYPFYFLKAGQKYDLNSRQIID